MSEQERIDSYVQPNEGTEYQLSVGEKLAAVRALSNLVDEMLLNNVDRIAYREMTDDEAKAKIELSSVGKLDDGTSVAVSTHRTYRHDDSHEDLVVIYDMEGSIHAYSTDGQGAVRRFDMVGENARSLIRDENVDILDKENISLEQDMGLNNQPVDANEIAQLKKAVDTVLQSR